MGMNAEPGRVGVQVVIVKITIDCHWHGSEIIAFSWFSNRYFCRLLKINTLHIRRFDVSFLVIIGILYKICKLT